MEAALVAASGGIGADHVLLVAGGSSNGPVEAAARLARDRARIVDIGKLNLNLPWNADDEKELDVVFSRSYGPGRYDPTYELEGVDYPIGYVRWTERRNLACFLDLISRGSLNIESLVSDVFPLERAVEVYEGLSSGSLGGIGVLFEYPAQREQITKPPSEEAGLGIARDTTPFRKTPGGVVRLGFIGAGNYASSVLLPLLAGDERVDLRRVATTRSLSAVNAQRRFHFSGAGTDIEEVLQDDSLDAVFIVTRHHIHAELTVAASSREGGLRREAVGSYRRRAVPSSRCRHRDREQSPDGGVQSTLCSVTCRNAIPLRGIDVGRRCPVLGKCRKARSPELVRRREARGFPVRR